MQYTCAHKYNCVVLLHIIRITIFPFDQQFSNDCQKIALYTMYSTVRTILSNDYSSQKITEIINISTLYICTTYIEYGRKSLFHMINLLKIFKFSINLKQYQNTRVLIHGCYCPS